MGLPAVASPGSIYLSMPHTIAHTGTLQYVITEEQTTGEGDPHIAHPHTRRTKYGAVFIRAAEHCPGHLGTLDGPVLPCPSHWATKRHSARADSAMSAKEFALF
jgi:hypothetical protein